MIYTVTFNPALDYIVRLDALTAGALNRAKEELVIAGGKGLNVSVMLKNLGVPSVALGFIAGFTGEALRCFAEEKGVRTEFIRVDGVSRINVKIKAERETEINGRGPDIPGFALEQLENKLQALPRNAVLVLAGSISGGLPQDTYARLLQGLPDHIRVAADMPGDLLRTVLPFRPWLVKPNREELCEVFGLGRLETHEAALYARRLCEMGARNAIVSLGDDGAFAYTERGEEFFIPAFRGRALDTVGAGDSLLAGFIAAKERGESDRVALRFAVAAGSATAFRYGLAEEAEVLDLLKRP